MINLSPYQLKNKKVLEYFINRNYAKGLEVQYTKEQLQGMSDIAINLAVGKKYRGEQMCVLYKNKCAMMVDSIEAFIPCNDWNDIMPIAERYEMKLNFNGIDCEVWTISVCGDTSPITYFSCNKNPQRVICEVFLMMDV